LTITELKTEEWRHSWDTLDYGPYGNKACNLCEEHLKCGKERIIFKDLNDCCGGFKLSRKVEDELRRRGFWETVNSNLQKKQGLLLFEEWKKRDPYLIDTDGYLEFVDRRMRAEELKRLIRLGHPDQHGEPHGRFEAIEMIQQRGLKILEDLGWPTDMDSHYMLIHGYEVRTLKDCLFWLSGSKTIDRYNADEEVWHVLEHWEPTDQTESVYPELTEEDKQYAIQCAVGHIAEAYVPRTAKNLYEQYGKKETIKFIRQQCNNFGCGSPMKPSVNGTPNGVEVYYNRDRECRRIPFTQILNHILKMTEDESSVFF